MHKIFSIGLLAFLACSGNIETKPVDSKQQADVTKSVQEKKVIDITVDEFLKKGAKFDGIILDVRTMPEVAEGIIPNAIHIDFYDEHFIEKVNQLDHSNAILVYCKSGGRSSKAAQQILSLGFKKVYNLKGGMMEWNKKNGPVDIPK